MEDKDGVMMIPYVVYESAQSRAERHIRRLVSVLALALVLLVLSNLAWLYAWTAYDYAEENSGVLVDGGDTGIANYIGQRGDIINGEDLRVPSDPDED